MHPVQPCLRFINRNVSKHSAYDTDASAYFCLCASELKASGLRCNSYLNTKGLKKVILRTTVIKPLIENNCDAL